MIINDRYINTFNVVYATAALVTLCTFLYFEESPTTSILKLGIIGMAPLVVVMRGLRITPALILCATYWTWCYFSSLFNGEQRFSTLGFLGMYLGTFVVYSQLLQLGTFTFSYFKRLLRWIIMAFGIILVMQQLCMLVGIYNMPIFNLHNQFFLSLTKLHSLTLEPSHSARVLAVLALCYWRMYEMECGAKPTLRNLFSGEMRWPMALFFWSMLTMGSGTAFAALGCLSLYFITRRTAAYVIPFIVAMYFAAGAMELSQFERANNMAQAMVTGDVYEVREADGSGAYRVVPLLNTLTKTDLTQAETWLGNGTAKRRTSSALNMNAKLGVIDQFGMVGFIITMLLVYLCIIRHFWSLETLLFFMLLGMSVGNIYYAWGCLLAMAGVTYFRKQWEQGLLETDNEDEEQDSVI